MYSNGILGKHGNYGCKLISILFLKLLFLLSYLDCHYVSVEINHVIFSVKLILNLTLCHTIFSHFLLQVQLYRLATEVA